MIHEANTVDWNVGDLVLHDMDKKSPNFLMIVTAIKPGGMVETRYSRPDELIPNCQIRQYGSYGRMPKRLRKHYEQSYENEKKYLHDPSRFGIGVTEQTEEVVDGKGSTV